MAADYSSSSHAERLAELEIPGGLWRCPGVGIVASAEVAAVERTINGAWVAPLCRQEEVVQSHSGDGDGFLLSAVGERRGVRSLGKASGMRGPAG